MIENLILLTIGLFILNLGATGLVHGASNIAQRLGISPLIVGLTVVALGTSAPEFVVSLLAVFKNQSGISIGNIIGSNIANIALILGISAIITPLKVDRHIITKWMPILLGITLLLGIFVRNGIFGSDEGWVFCTLAVGYIFLSIRSARSGDKSIPDNSDEISSPSKNQLLDILAVVGGIAALIWSSDIIVNASVGLMRIWGISETIIGLTLIAIGTSLPELATSIVAAAKGHAEMCVGNIIGSNIFNTLFVLGGVALFGDITFEADLINFHTWILIILTLFLFPILRTKFEVNKKEGAFLLICYSIFMAIVVMNPTWK